MSTVKKSSLIAARPTASSLKIASAVALICGSYAAHGAVTNFVATDVRVVGTEQASVLVAADSAALVGLPAMRFEVRSTGYVDTDRVVLTVSGATVRSAAAIGTVVCNANTLTTPTMNLVYNATASSGNTIVLTVANRNADAVWNGGNTGMQCTIPLNGIQIEAAGLTSNRTVTVNYQAFSAASGFATAYDVLRDASNAATTLTALVSIPQVSLAPSDTTLATNPTNGIVTPSTVVTAAASRAGGLSAEVATSGTIFSANGTTACSSTAAAGVSSEANANACYSDVLRWNYRVEDGNAALADSDGLMVINASNPVSVTSNGTVLVSTITGGFEFLDDDGNGCTAADLDTGPNRVVAISRAVPAVAATYAATGNAPGLVISADCSTLTHTHTIAAADGRDTTHALLFTFRGYQPQAAAATNLLTGTVTAAQVAAAGSQQGRLLSAKTFGITTRWQNAGLTTTYTTLAPSGGSWTAPVTTASTSSVIPYLPYGAGISRIVYATNRGLVGSTTSITARNDAGTVCAATNFPTVSIPAGGVVNIGGSIDAGVRACFPTIDSSSGKVTVTVTYNGSTSLGTHTTTSSYNVSGNRNIVINTSNTQTN